MGGLCSSHLLDSGLPLSGSFRVFPTPAELEQLYDAAAPTMLLYTMRWGMDRNPEEQEAARFFATLADICVELAANPDQFWLPRPRSPELAQAVSYALANLDAALHMGEVAHLAGVSERTLLRRFAAETRLSWRGFLSRARMIRAMEMLEANAPPVSEVADATGFESISAFSTAFRRFTGETPSAYRRRLATLTPVQGSVP